MVVTQKNREQTISNADEVTMTTDEDGVQRFQHGQTRVLIEPVNVIASGGPITIGKDEVSVRLKPSDEKEQNARVLLDVNGNGKADDGELVVEIPAMGNVGVSRVRVLASDIKYDYVPPAPLPEGWIFADAVNRDREIQKIGSTLKEKVVLLRDNKDPSPGQIDEIGNLARQLVGEHQGSNNLTP